MRWYMRMGTAASDAATAPTGDAETVALADADAVGCLESSVVGVDVPSAVAGCDASDERTPVCENA
jgi:hypothetical protein